MAFPESVKARVRRKAHLTCCLCKSLGVEVHHLIPQEEHGEDTEENAAPLCPSCHETYGANPQKRKFIREARDLWYEICAKRFTTDPEQFEEIKNLVRRTVSTEEFVGFKDEILAQLRDRLPLAPPAVENHQQDAGKSPSGVIYYEIRKTSDGEGEVWLWQENPAYATMLCSSLWWRNLSLHFSPDDNWLIVRNGGPSVGMELTLYRREGGVTYREEVDADIGGKAERLAFQMAELPNGKLHHRYSSCLSWSQDSESVLIRVTGYGNGVGINRNGEESFCIGFGMSWIGVYDLRTGHATGDLGVMNANAVASWEVD